MGERKGAYERGFEARQEGRPATANPHIPLSNAWLAWADGWKDLDEHLKVRDEAFPGWSEPARAGGDHG